MNDIREPVARSVETVTHGRFLVRPPVSRQGGATPVEHASVVVGFHGYGENAERHLAELQQVPGSDGCRLVAVQGLHRFYGGRMADWDDAHPLPVVASWMTRQDRELAIADNVAYVDRVVQALAREQPFGRLVFVGFSQGVAMAFRAAVSGAVRADGVIALGGDVPPDVRDAAPSRFGTVLVGRGTADRWYTDEKLKADVEFLQAKGVPVRALTFEGGHGWTDEFRAAAGEFLRAVATT